MGASDEPDIMTWFPRREDYEDAPVAVMPDETIEEKVDRRVVSTDDNNTALVLGSHIYLCNSDSYRVMWRFYSTHISLRLNETISVAQTYIKEAVDGNDLTLELKIYRVMDLNQVGNLQ